MMPRDAELHELVGAYALNALEHDEAELFERHLEACPRCRAELRDHRETAAVLAHVGSTAPADVWDGIAAQLDEAPPNIDTILPMFARPGAPKRTQTGLRRRGLVMLAAAAAAIVGVNSVVLLKQRDQIARLDPANASSVQAFADRAASVATSRVATLRQPDGTVVADVVITADGRGYLTRGKFQALDVAHTYQLWALTADNRPVSLGVLGRKPVARAFTAELAMTKIAVTVEGAGGATAPTSPPLVLGELGPVS